MFPTKGDIDVPIKQLETFFGKSDANTRYNKATRAPEEPMENIEFFFDYTCPYAYLAATQIEGVAERTGRPLKWRPMLLGGVFRALEVPQVLFKTLNPSKARHNFADMHRWAHMWGVPLTMPSDHPRRSVEALRATLALPEEQRPTFIHAVFKAYWVDGRDIAERSILQELLEECGYTEASAGPFEQGVKDALRAETDEAIARGVFGAPATFIGESLFWGQDRLWMVEERLGGSFPHPEPPLPNEGKDTFDFYFDLSSPFAFLAATEVRRFAERHGVQVRWCPIFLGGLFKVLGGPTVPLNTFSPSKRQFIAKDMQRWAKHRDVPLKWPSQFPVMTVKAMRILLSMGNDCGDLALRFFNAYWCDDRDIQSPEVIGEIIQEAGLPAELIEAAGDPQWKTALIDATQQAAEKGIFGVPTFIAGDTLIWGQDRFTFLEMALRGWNDPAVEQTS